MLPACLTSPFAALEIFEGLDAHRLAQIARRADRVVYRPGNVITREHANADGAILVISGDAERLSAHGGRGAEVVPQGALITELGMLIETEHASTIIARSIVRALHLARSDLHELMQIDPEIADHFVQRISGRLNHAAEALRAIDEGLVGISGQRGLDATPWMKPQRAQVGRATQAIH